MKRWAILAALAAPAVAAMATGDTAAEKDGATLTKARPTAEKRAGKVRRYGSVIGLKKEKLDEYKRLHAAVWPSVLKRIKDCHIRNYSIYLRKLPDGNYYLFAYFEYTGDDFEADMKKMAADEATQRWWKLTDPCQTPLADRSEGKWWADMEEVFHTD